MNMFQITCFLPTFVKNVNKIIGPTQSKFWFYVIAYYLLLP